MKKYIPSEEEIKMIIKMYKEDLLGSHSISEKLKLNKQIILRVLKENNVMVGPSGRRYIGGKKVSDKKYREKNKEKITQKYKIWLLKNEEKVKIYYKNYVKNNIDKIRETKRNYEKTRKNNDPIYKLISNFRTAIYQVLKENRVDKNRSYFDVLEYSPEQLITHLENQFNKGMSWENYGEWHVDHKLPITYFNIKEMGDSEFMKCWSLDNLQPLWAKENIKKYNKII